jgi:hypothetical protein
MLPACYVTIGEQVVAEVVEPQSRYFCPCECHLVGVVEQLGLFEETHV